MADDTVYNYLGAATTLLRNGFVYIPTETLRSIQKEIYLPDGCAREYSYDTTLIEQQFFKGGGRCAFAIGKRIKPFHESKVASLFIDGKGCLTRSLSCSDLENAPNEVEFLFVDNAGHAGVSVNVTGETVRSATKLQVLEAMNFRRQYYMFLQATT